MEPVLSPLTGDVASLVRRVPTKTLVDAYLERFGFDARPCFEGLDEIFLYECRSTGLKFYYPPRIAGPESLYLQLQKFDWNYKEDKWEHRVALGHVLKGDRVLDVGCGQGSFIARASANGAIATGIELNKSAAAKAAQRGCEVRSEMLGEHAGLRPGYYDVVASFQVLEHVTDPRAFIAGCVDVLKPGGLLILGVPNDDGFVGMDDDAVLNQPPHHMSLWTRRSLESLSTLFPLAIKAFEVEPLSEPDWYQALMERKYLKRSLQRQLYYRLGGAELFKRFIEENAHTIAGHSILAIYTKA